MCPRNGLALLQGAVEDTDQCQTTRNGERSPGWSRGCPRRTLVSRRRARADDGLEQRLKVVVVGQLAACGWVRWMQRQPYRMRITTGTFSTASRPRSGTRLRVGCQAEQQVHGLANDLVDGSFGRSNLVSPRGDHGQLSSQCLTQHEAGSAADLRMRPRKWQSPPTMDRRPRPLATEVGVAGVSITLMVMAPPLAEGLLEHGGVLRQNGDALSFLFRGRRKRRLTSTSRSSAGSAVFWHLRVDG